MRKKGVRLSQCMIVRDEEKNIERALSWGKDILYEQIVVDTGSTDKTVELARAMGAAVYNFQWIDDFAAAKNFAISKASGDWIAFLDADEYFMQKDARKLMSLLDKLDETWYHVMLTSMVQVEQDGRILAGGTQTRIFRNIKGLQYGNRIHEQLVLKGRNIIKYTVDASEELTIFHTGYGHEASITKHKGERNARLIRMSLQEDPDNYSLMGYLADCFYIKGDVEKAEDWYRKSINLIPEYTVQYYNSCVAHIFSRLMVILCDKDEEQDLMEVYEQAVRLVPKESDFDFIVGKCYTKRKDFQKGACYLERAIRKLEKYGQAGGGALLSGNLQSGWGLLALCHYENGELAECVRYCTCLLKADRYLMSPLVMMMRVFKQEAEKNEGKTSDCSAEVAGMLRRLYNVNNLKDRMFLLRAAMEARYDGLIKIFRDAFSEKELECFDNTMRQRDGQS